MQALRRLALLLLFAAWPVMAQERITVAFPGPLNLPFLPLDLASKIGADRAEGIELVPRHVSGGTALKDLQTRNVDFAVPGIPAALSARARGADVVVIASIGDHPLFVMAVRNELKGTVKRPRDLAGRVVGVTGSTLAAKTTSHQVAELLLKHDGVPLNMMRLTPIGQSWEEVEASVKSGFVDGFVVFEPFPSRLIEAGLVYPIVSLATPAEAARIPGGAFLFAGMTTRRDVIERAPATAEKVVATVRRTLAWIASHKPEEIVAALKIDDEGKRNALLKGLRRYPQAYSADGKFSQRQIAETQRFFDATAEGDDARVTLESILDTRWAGTKP